MTTHKRSMSRAMAHLMQRQCSRQQGEYWPQPSQRLEVIMLPAAH